MYKKMFVIIVVLALSLTACTVNGIHIDVPANSINGSGKVVTESRDVTGFSSVDMQSIGNLTITQGNVESLTISADENLLPYITTRVVNGTLEIGMKPNTSLNPSRTIEYNLVMKTVEGVQLSGFGNIESEGLKGGNIEVKLAGSGDINIAKIEADSLLVRISGFGDFDSQSVKAKTPNIEITGSGDINVDELDAEDLAVKISGFGDAILNGKTNTQNVQILGSGNFKAGDLSSETATVKITGFGDATLWASETLGVTVTGSGNVEYYGNPRVTQTMTGFGKVNSLGEHK
jgi:predicted small secreted protein